MAGAVPPDRVLGEVGRYYSLPKPGHRLTGEELTEFGAARLANHKVPASWSSSTNCR